MKKPARQLFVFPTLMVLALYTTALGFLAEPLQKMFGFTLAEVGLFSTMQSIGSGVALVLCFCIFSAMNRSRVYLISAALFSGGVIALGFGDNLVVFYALFVKRAMTTAARASAPLTPTAIQT